MSCELPFQQVTFNGEGRAVQRPDRSSPGAAPPSHPSKQSHLPQTHTHTHTHTHRIMYCKLVCNTRTCSNDDRCAATAQQPSPSAPSPSAAPRAVPSRREGANTAFSKSSLPVPCEGVVARRADPGEAPNRTAAAKLRRRTVAHDASTTEAVCGSGDRCCERNGTQMWTAVREQDRNCCVSVTEVLLT